MTTADTLAERLKVALILGEPLYCSAAELRSLKDELVTQYGATMDQADKFAGEARFMGVELVVDLDKALLQGNRYGYTEAELARKKAEQDIVNRMLDNFRQGFGLHPDHPNNPRRHP